MRRIIPAFVLVIMVVSSIFTIYLLSDNSEGLLIDENSLTDRDIIVIDGNDDFTSENGVRSGTGSFTDPYVIENWTISAGENKGIFIQGTSKYFVIQNCWIRQSSGSQTGGIFLMNVGNGSIQNTNLSDSGEGIYLLSSSNILIRNCYFNGNIVSVQSSLECNRITVENNTFWRNNNGVEFARDTTDSTIQNNSFTQVLGHAIVLRESHQNEIRSNRINFSLKDSNDDRPSGISISLRGSNDNIISDNICRSDYASGLILDTSHNNRILNNQFLASDPININDQIAGLSIVYSKQNVISNNTFTNGSLKMDGRDIEEWTTNTIHDSNILDGHPIQLIKNESTSKVWSGGDRPIIFANCSNQTIQNMSVSSYRFGIMIGFSRDLIVQHNSFSESRYGINIRSSERIRLTDNDMEDMTYGIGIWDSEDIRVDNNTISKCSSTGVEIRESFTCVVEYNDLISNVNSIGSSTYDHESQFHIIRYNRIFQGKYGISLWRNGNRIIGNIVDSQTEHGMSFNYIENNTISENLVINCETGIEIEHYSFHNIFSYNQIMGNQIGLAIKYASQFNTISMNEFIENIGHGIDLGYELQTPTVGDNSIINNSFIGNNQGGIQAAEFVPGNNWDDGFGSGNYWSDYESRYVPPALNDGTKWDTPYVVDGENGGNDSFPLVGIPVQLDQKLLISGINIERAFADIDYSVQYSHAYSGNRSENISWTFSTNASWLSFNPNQVLSGKPTYSNIGTYWVNISVSDGDLSDFTNFTIEVIVKNFPPRITTQEVTRIDQWDRYWVDFDATDDGNTLVWKLITQAEFLSIDSSSGVLSGTPGLNDIGTFIVNVSVNDGELWDITYFNLTVNDVNDPPMQNLSKPYFLMMEDTTLSFPINDLFFNYDDDPMEISVEHTGHVNATIDNNDDLIIIPDPNWHGTHKMNFSVSDGYYNKTFSIDVIVQLVNDVPSQLTITLNSTTMVENGDQTVSADFYDPDINDSANITWYIDGTIVSYDPSFNLSLDAGSYNLTLRVTDASGNYTEITVVISVEISGSNIVPPGPDFPWIIVLVVSFLTLAMIGALLFILRRRNSPEEKEHLTTIPSRPASMRTPGRPDLDLSPMTEFTQSQVNTGHLGEEMIEQDVEVPWFDGSDDTFNGLMEEALSTDIPDVHKTSSMMRRLKNRKDNGDLTEEEYRELRSVLERIKEE